MERARSFLKDVPSMYIFVCKNFFIGARQCGSVVSTSQSFCVNSHNQIIDDLRGSCSVRPSVNQWELRRRLCALSLVSL